ncbi:hypothetical protein Indivirus_4_16 [Indivirus ILV1]|uniref:Uncharacterized protein n=1 Tax=Indivirus ILV1 TaxID=1977633 RepID=A0A1V0SDX8_9VIRU|nr:hypothetical protein Indivirus_4_16 [Indivirus ILV1]
MEDEIIVHDEKGKKKCAWFIGKDNEECNKNVINDTKYCKSHQYVIDYTDKEKKESKRCSGCRKVKWFPADQATCGCGNKRAAKANEKRKEANKDKVEQKKAEQKKKEDEKQKLINQGHIECPGCAEARPHESFIGIANQTTKKCQVCRDKQKKNDTNRKKSRDWAKERIEHPETYEKKKEYNREYQKIYVRK